MAVPKFQSLMLPLLRLTADGQEKTLSEAEERIAYDLDLTEADRMELLPSGTQRRLRNRIGWARTHLKHAGLLHYTRRGYFTITDEGRDLLSQNPSEINLKTLDQYPGHVEFRSKGRQKDNSEDSPTDRADVTQNGDETPEERMENAYDEIKGQLNQDLLAAVMGCSSQFFENLVIDLLLKMGYGGSRSEAGKATHPTSDGGIDGIINEDRLGLEIIYVQAKRWESVVGRPEIQKFQGALAAHRARKGVFLTTSSFTRDAVTYTDYIDSKIVLIDGNRLAELMIEHNVGVSPTRSFDIKRIDSDYFAED